ncbi:MAG TPA: transglycosylase domain-containing protein, partial [Chloroflexia bacterium]|nr:transglycosylase domain-containing protein [Chloroflexia bacterium]
MPDPAPQPAQPASRASRRRRATSGVAATVVAGRRRLLLALLAGCLSLGAAGYAWLFGDLPAVDGLAAPGPFQSSRILDRNGHLLYDLVDPQLGQRTLLPLAAVPRALRDATISTEDANFYSHPGVDGWGLLRALGTNLQGGQGLAGGSTITQQL